MEYFREADMDSFRRGRGGKASKSASFGDGLSSHRARNFLGCVIGEKGFLIGCSGSESHFPGHVRPAQSGLDPFRLFHRESLRFESLSIDEWSAHRDALLDFVRLESEPRGGIFAAIGIFALSSTIIISGLGISELISSSFMKECKGEAFIVSEMAGDIIMESGYI